MSSKYIRAGIWNIPRLLIVISATYISLRMSLPLLESLTKAGIGINDARLLAALLEAVKLVMAFSLVTLWNISKPKFLVALGVGICAYSLSIFINASSLMYSFNSQSKTIVSSVELHSEFEQITNELKGHTVNLKQQRQDYIDSKRDHFVMLKAQNRRTELNAENDNYQSELKSKNEAIVKANLNLKEHLKEKANLKANLKVNLNENQGKSIVYDVFSKLKNEPITYIWLYFFFASLLEIFQSGAILTSLKWSENKPTEKANLTVKSKFSVDLSLFKRWPFSNSRVNSFNSKVELAASEPPMLTDQVIVNSKVEIQPKIEPETKPLAEKLEPEIVELSINEKKRIFIEHIENLSVNDEFMAGELYEKYDVSSHVMKPEMDRLKRIGMIKRKAKGFIKSSNKGKKVTRIR